MMYASHSSHWIFMLAGCCCVDFIKFFYVAANNSFYISISICVPNAWLIRPFLGAEFTATATLFFHPSIFFLRFSNVIYSHRLLSVCSAQILEYKKQSRTLFKCRYDLCPFSIMLLAIICIIVTAARRSGRIYSDVFCMLHFQFCLNFAIKESGNQNILSDGWFLINKTKCH